MNKENVNSATDELLWVICKKYLEDNMYNPDDFEQVKYHRAYFISKKSDLVYSSYKNKILKVCLNGDGTIKAGYKQVFMDGKWHRIHRLKLTQWKRDPLPGEWANHEDGDKMNNDLDNLVWGDISYNIQHAWDTGLSKKKTGDQHWRTGVKMSKESKAIMSDKKLGENHPKFKGWFHTPKGRFASANAAGEENGVAGKTVKKRCNLPIWEPLGWRFEKYTHVHSSL